MTDRTERTPEGEQFLVSGIAPVTDRERLELLAKRPLRPSRPQRPFDFGLFDDTARRQLDLMDCMTPATTTPIEGD